MNFRHLPQHDLASLAEHVAELLAGPELASIDPVLRASLIEAIGNLPATLRSATDAAEEIEGQRMAAISTRNDAQLQLASAMIRVKSALKTSGAPKEEYDLCLISYPSRTRVGVYQAVEPTELSGAGASNGVNLLVFKGNNKPTSVAYEIYRREGTAAEWDFLASTTRQRFEDKPVTPGQYYEYRVRAVAANSVSQFSNTAVVYAS